MFFKDLSFGLVKSCAASYYKVVRARLLDFYISINISVSGEASESYVWSNLVLLIRVFKYFQRK